MNGQNGRDDEAASAYVVERFGDQMLTETAVPVLLVDLGVGERDQSGTGQVLAVAGELAVAMDLIPVALWMVAGDDAHWLPRERLTGERPAVGEFDIELARGESPTPLLLGELVFIAEVRDEDLAFAVFAEHVMSDAVRFCRRSGLSELDRALSVEVHRDVVLVQRVEYGDQCFASLELFGGWLPGAVHVDGEVGVLGEEGSLLIGFSSICAASVAVDQLADREPVARVLGGE
jgi:hypothetical protein